MPNDFATAEDRPILTEQHVVGNRAMIPRTSLYQYMMTWLERPAFKEDTIRTNRPLQGR